MDKQEILRVGGHPSRTKGTRSPKLTVVFPEGTLNKLQKEGKKQGVSTSEIVRIAVRDYFGGL